MRREAVQKALQGWRVKRTEFKRKALAMRIECDRTDEFKLFSLPRASATMAVSAQEKQPVVVSKNKPVRSEAYRRLVASLACCHCKLEGYSQCAHEDQNKGAATKTDDRRSYPACGPHHHEPGCHHLVGTARIYPKEKRRELEAKWVLETQREILKQGLWPKRVPKPEGLE